MPGGPIWNWPVDAPGAWVLAAEIDGRLLVVAVREDGVVAAHIDEGDGRKPPN